MKVPHGKVMKSNPKKDYLGNNGGRPRTGLWAKLPHLIVFLTCIILLGVTIQMWVEQIWGQNLLSVARKMEPYVSQGLLLTFLRTVI